MKYEFRWNPEKAKSNLVKHGISFEDAALVFTDPNAVTLNNGFRNNEQRWETIGMVNNNLVLIVIHTIFNDVANTEIIRIISARKVEKNKRKVYERNYL